MAKRIFFFLFIHIFLAPDSKAQPIPCVEPPEMTSFCADACIICDIDGFTGRHDANILGQAPPGFAGECTFVAHNMQWIAFIAGSVDLSVALTVSNCELNIGLEFGLYKGNNCENFERISNCFGGAAGIVAPGQTGIIENTEPLIIGQYYYIVMDGALGDNCDWTFTVLEGSTEVSPLTNSGTIEGDLLVCPDLPFLYEVDTPIGATELEWSVNGVVQSSVDSILEYIFPGDGTYTICVTAKNACDEAPPSCIQVEVESLVTEIVDILCEGETYEIAGTSITVGGYYEFDLISEAGCDSLVTLDLTLLQTPLLNLQLDICDGDTLYIGNTPFTSSGSYQEVLVSAQQCDSIVNLDLNTIICNITSSETTSPVICNGDATGSISFSVNSGTAPFNFNWQELNGNYFGSGTIDSIGELILIDNIPAGTYLINIEDGFGNLDIILVVLSQPALLELEFFTSDYNGFNVSCPESNDGTITALPTGGIPDYTYSWSSGQSSNSITDLFPGDYHLTVTDQLACSVESEINLIPPDPLVLIAEFRDPDCGGLSTGRITAVQTIGGVGGYTFSLDGMNYSENQVFDNLSPGIYTLQVMDNNACITELSDTLVAPQIPIVSLGDDFEISLGDFIKLNPTINDIDIQQIKWQSIETLDCTDCLEPGVLPLNSSNYILTVTSIDGCSDFDSLYINVNKFRKLFAPNVFTPNFDGVNDNFTIFGGPEVAIIRRLLIFDRWGALLFEANDIEKGIPSLGWDGTFKGKDVTDGVYVWMAEIAFIDGIVLTYSGDISIVK